MFTQRKEEREKKKKKEEEEEVQNDSKVFGTSCWQEESTVKNEKECPGKKPEHETALTILLAKSRQEILSYTYRTYKKHGMGAPWWASSWGCSIVAAGPRFDPWIENFYMPWAPKKKKKKKKDKERKEEKKERKEKRGGPVGGGSFP